MWKKRTGALALALLCLLLSSCAAPHRGGAFDVGSDVVPLPSATPHPTLPAPPTPALPSASRVTASAYRPEAVPSAYAAREDFSTALYVLLTEAIREGKGDVDASMLTYTPEQFEGVRAYLLSRNPWGTLTDVIADDVEPGRLVLSYSLDDMDACKEAAARFDAAASAAIAACVPENATQLAAALSLYKYVAQTVTQNFEDEDFEAADAGLYSAIADGRGTDRAYAYAYSFLLDQVGVQNAVVLSDTGEHAWNQVTIDGVTFYCDAQMEAGLSGGQALQGFGLSNADMTAFNGWGNGGLEDGAILEAGQTILPAAAEAACADVDAASGALYLDSLEGVPGVYRLDLDTGEVLQVLETPVRGLAVLGSDLYYLSEADSLLYCASVADGTLIQAPEGVALTAIRRVGSELRYTTAEETEGTLSLQ